MLVVWFFFFYFLLRYFKMKKKRLYEFMVLKQQSNSLQEGPRCNPFTANGTGWSKGGCTHDTEENRRALLPSCAPAPRLPQAGFRHKDRLPTPAGQPWSPHSSLQPSPSLAGDAALPTATCDEAPLAPRQAKDRGSASRTGVSRLPPRGWPCGMCCFLV